jgi:SAM-dependent methyltransferase
MKALDPLALPFDQYQRYTAVAQIADQVRTRLGQSHLRVLDVGGFYRTRLGQSILPLVHFLPQDQVLAVDLIAKPLPNYALASGRSLPFGNQAFDLVVSCDTLEHVLPADRPAFVDELLRVACHYLVLIAPFDSELTRQAERTLSEYMIAQGIHHEQLQEHLDHGLPTVADLGSIFAKHGLAATDFADGYLPNWLAMMLIKHTPGESLDFHLNLDRYYNRHFSPSDRREPAYRHVFVVAKPGDEALLPNIADVAQLTDPVHASPDLGFAVDLIDLLDQSQPTALTKTLRQTQIQLADARSRLAALESENARLRQLVAGYERGRFIRFMRWLHNQRLR